MNTPATLFDAGEIIARSRREAARVKATVSDDEVTGVAGAALWGPVLDRLNVVDVFDRDSCARSGRVVTLTTWPLSGRRWPGG